MKANNVVPPGAGQLLDSCLALLSAVKRIQVPPVVAGFDGFVDTILHAVSERRSATEYSRLLTLHAFSEKILAASGGRNTNIEMVPRLTKIGGNGPILANALAHFEIPVGGTAPFPGPASTYRRFRGAVSRHNHVTGAPRRVAVEAGLS